MRSNYSPKIYILYTGGTIGMSKVDKEGLLPVKGLLSNFLQNLNKMSNNKLSYKLSRVAPLIDSSDIKEEDWKKILENLFRNYNKYDSFIIIHGTDTLSYTGSVLSFFLKDFRKTVILTGSQLPLTEVDSDAYQNITDSIRVSHYNIRPVIIVFGKKILQANRTTKISSSSLIPFVSPDWPLIGYIPEEPTSDILFNKCFLNEKPTEVSPQIPEKWNLSQWDVNSVKIVSLTILPQDNTKTLEALIKLKPYAIILRTYGTGNVPIHNPYFIKSLEKAIKKGILLINNSQCPSGGIKMDSYQTGLILKRIGIITSKDMTFECVYAKLFYIAKILGRFGDFDLVKKLFLTNIVGEIGH